MRENAISTIGGQPAVVAEAVSQLGIVRNSFCAADGSAAASGVRLQDCDQVERDGNRCCAADGSFGPC